MARKVQGQAWSVQVKGLESLLRATDAAGGSIKKNTRKRLRQAAEPVRAQAQRDLSGKFGADSIRVGVSVRRTGVVSVEQRRRRTTGLRPDFGRQQMHGGKSRRGFIPALEDNEANTVRLLQEAVDETAREWSSRP